MAITIDGTNGLTTDNAALKLDGTTLTVDDTNNRVGIGTSSPSGLLDIEGATATQYINATSGNANTLYQLAGTTTGSIEVGGGNSVYITANNASGNIYLRAGGATTRATIAANGYLRLAGGGIQFNGDTAAANALDDYEEGTWTPTIQISGSSTGITYGTQSGRYTKIGNCVTIWAYIGLSSKGSNSGAVTLTGIPFTYGNISALYTANSMTTKGTATSPLYTYAQSFPNQSYFAIKKQSFDSDVANTDLNNNSEFLFSITYMVT